jgi:uncharacterized protein
MTATPDVESPVGPALPCRTTFGEEAVVTGTVTDQVTRMKDLYEAFGRGDIPAVVAAMDEGVEWYEAEGNPWSPGRPFVGAQQVIEGVFQRIGAEFDGFEVRPARFMGDGDTVIMEGRYRAQRNKATGKPLDAEVVHIWDLRNGKIVHFHQYVDTRQLAAVLGASD